MYSSEDPTSHCYKLGEHGQSKSFILEIKWSATYPTEIPEVKLSRWANCVQNATGQNMNVRRQIQTPQRLCQSFRIYNRFVLEVELWILVSELYKWFLKFSLFLISSFPVFTITTWQQMWNSASQRLLKVKVELVCLCVKLISRRGCGDGGHVNDLHLIWMGQRKSGDFVGGPARVLGCWGHGEDPGDSPHSLDLTDFILLKDKKLNKLLG